MRNPDAISHDDVPHVAAADANAPIGVSGLREIVQAVRANDPAQAARDLRAAVDEALKRRGKS